MWLLLLCVLRSGGTPEHPGMLQYACKLWANVRLVSPARVLPNGSRDEGNPESMATLLGGRPLLAFVFDNMEVCAILLRWLLLAKRISCWF